MQHAGCSWACEQDRSRVEGPCEPLEMKSQVNCCHSDLRTAELMGPQEVKTREVLGAPEGQRVGLGASGRGGGQRRAPGRGPWRVSP